MAELSKIEWCDSTFNPWTGCQAVSPACDHCYAEALEKRFGHTDRWGPHGTRVRTSTTYWKQPIKWNKQAEAYGIRRRVFCASLADVFDHKAPQEWRTDLWRLINDTPHLDWLLLTKRPQNVCRMVPSSWGDGWPNVWLGATVENAEEMIRRAHALASVPAAVVFWSVEPMLSAITLPNTDLPDWIICGGESGPHKRPFDLTAARSLRDQCAANGIAFFFKQVDKVQPIPPDLMIRQFPKTEGRTLTME